MSRSLVIALLAVHLAGCQWILSIPDVEPRESQFGCPQADATVACQDWTARYFSGCDLCKPSAALVLDGPGNYVYNTDEGTLIDPMALTMTHISQTLSFAAGDVRLVSVEGIRIGPNARLRAEGTMPLMIAAWNEIEVLGIIDASSSDIDGPGAGADPGEGCMASAAQVGESGEVAGAGGGGGAFNGNGGRGGDADADGLSAHPQGGANGAGINKPMEVRGGCPGGDGGAGDRTSGIPAGGDGGEGGGAIHLVAQKRIAIIDGSAILAGGRGGHGGRYVIGKDGGGGGGGGSGGYIGLEAPAIVASGAVLAANGGGGGEGADANQNGNPGKDGAANATPAAGGSAGATSGANGGAGGSRDELNGSPASSIQDGGGGGGGGSAGYLLVIGSYTPTNTTESPMSIKDSP